MGLPTTAKGECMQYNNQAFTLIELLVVVLIIGILAAIALPQYQRAVEKSRAVEMRGWLSNAQKAMDLYFLEHGTTPICLTRKENMDQSPISLGLGKEKENEGCETYNNYFTAFINCFREGATCAVYLSRNKINPGLGQDFYNLQATYNPATGQWGARALLYKKGNHVVSGAVKYFEDLGYTAAPSKE